MFLLQKNKPLPKAHIKHKKSKGSKKFKYPFELMGVGDSFDVPRDGYLIYKKCKRDRVSNTVSASAAYYTKVYNKDSIFCVRILCENFVRCKRIK